MHILGNRNVLCERNLPRCFYVLAAVKLTFKQTAEVGGAGMVLTSLPSGPSANQLSGLRVTP